MLALRFPSFSLSQGLFVTAMVLVGVLVGGAISILPWMFVLAPFVLGSAVLLAYFKPTWALVPYAMISFFVPSFPAVDVVTAGFMVIIAYRTYQDGSLQRALNQLPRVFWILLAVVLISGFVGKFIKGNSTPFIYREARIFMHLGWVVFFLALFEGQNQIERLRRLVLILALSVSALALLQALFGVSIGAPGRVGDLDSMSENAMQTVRVQLPGFSFVMAGLVFCCVRIIARPRYLWTLLPLVALFGAGLIVNYGRGLWFWSAFAIFLGACFFRVKGVGLLLLAATLLLSVGGATINAVKPEIIKTITRRVESTFEEGGGKTSFGWRQIEMQQGKNVLMSSAGLGVGLGGVYRKPLLELIKWDDFPRYTHNSYLFLSLKLSVYGAFIYLLLMKFILRRAWGAATTEGEPDIKADGAALFAFFFSFLALSTTQPELMEHPSAMLIAICLAMAIAMTARESDRNAIAFNPAMRRISRQ